MSYTDINVDDYGWVAEVIVTEDGSPVDISSYTTRTFYFTAPSGAVLTKTPSFGTDGSDGVLQYTALAGDFDEAGQWSLRARIEKTGVRLTTATGTFTIGE